jgi:predicted RNA-binding Zn-ribbon protein involved in translation (DUF1610 family)
MKSCEICKIAIKAGHKYCPNCGEKLIILETSTPLVNNVSVMCEHCGEQTVATLSKQALEHLVRSSYSLMRSLSSLEQHSKPQS